MERRLVFIPIEIRGMKTKNPQRRLTRIRARTLGRLATESGGEVNSFGIRVEQEFVWVKSIPGIRTVTLRTVHPIGIMTGAVEIVLFQTAMPNALGLVAQRFEPNLDDWGGVVLFLEQEKRHLGRVFGVKRKIISLFFGNESDSQRHGRTFDGRPVYNFWFPLTLIHSCL